MGRARKACGDWRPNRALDHQSRLRVQRVHRPGLFQPHRPVWHRRSRRYLDRTPDWPRDWYGRGRRPHRGKFRRRVLRASLPIRTSRVDSARRSISPLSNSSENHLLLLSTQDLREFSSRVEYSGLRWGLYPHERTTVMRDPNNDQLLARLQSGDDRALTDLADTYGAKIYQLAFRYLRNKEDAEEITQDVLFKVYRSVGTFRGDA